ncbi:unnamed protein product [Owenia fusiformis]|uniref:Uncharacterized protein n=1 Tax=Owenia fusiformis TaxID=6347 RepID=A0A8J1TSG4_OWEFU|nr:unnamed protein product [Owenia fusiformis]
MFGTTTPTTSRRTPNARIKNLPRKETLADGTDVEIDYLNEEDYGFVFKLFKNAGEKGEGYSNEEFVDFNSFVKMVKRDPYFTLMDTANKKIIGAVSVHPSRLLRSANGVLAGGNAVVNPEYRNRKCNLIIVKIHFDFAKELGFHGFLGETFAINKAVRKSAETIGITVVGYIPKSAYLYRRGWVNSLAMYTPISDEYKLDDVRLVMPNDEFLTSKILDPRGKVDPWNNKVTSLPRTFNVQDGREFTARSAEETEYFEVYNIIKDAADDGVGFGIDDFPTFEYFVDCMARGHVFCITEKASDKIVGMFTCIPSKYSRTPNSPFAAGPAIMKDGYRGIGIYGNIREISEDIAKELGYQGILGDMLEINQPIIDSYERYGYKLVARIPRSSFVKGEGWVAAVAFYKPFS